MEFHCEVVSPSWFQCRTSFWFADLLLGLICFLDIFRRFLLLKNQQAQSVTISNHLVEVAFC